MQAARPINIEINIAALWNVKDVDRAQRDGWSHHFQPVLQAVLVYHALAFAFHRVAGVFDLLTLAAWRVIKRTGSDDERKEVQGVLRIMACN